MMGDSASTSDSLSPKPVPDDAAAPKPSTLLRALNALSFVGTLATNGVVGSKIGKVSRSYPNNIVPDGWAFAIWGIIYTLVFCFVLYQAWCPTPAASSLVTRVGPCFILSNLSSSLWVLVFVQGTPFAVGASCPFLFLLLASLMGLQFRIGAWREERTLTQLLLFDVTFSIYAGWASVASIVNCAAAGVANGWTANGSAWSVVMMSVATLVNLLVLGRRRDPVFPLVLVWATFAIHTGHAQDKLVATASLCIAVGVLVVDVLACVAMTTQGMWLCKVDTKTCV